MTVKDLISKLLEMPMYADVFISDPTPHEDAHGICNGYYFGIDDVKPNSDFVEIEFTDWRSQKHCKDCKFFEYDSVAKVDGIPLIVAHEICSKWGDGCKTKEDGFCFMFEPRESREDKK